MLVQAVKRNNEWIIPDIPELYAQNEDRIFLDIQLAHKVDIDKESNADDGQLWNDEYLEKNWKKLIVTSSMPPSYEDSDQYREDYGNYLLEKHQ